MTKAVIYTRVSTKEQEKKGYSLVKQEEICREYCQTKGYEVVTVITDSTSGFTFEREGIEQLQKFLPDIDIVVAVEMDRLARDPVVFGMITLLCKQQNTRIEFVNESKEEGSTIVEDVKVAVAKDENIKRLERVKRGKEAKFALGGHVAKAPFGYRFDKNVKPSLLVPSEDFGKVQSIFKLRAEGKTYKEIIETLSLFTSKKQKDYSEVAKIMGIKKILKNPCYLGYVQYKKQLRKGKHLPAVSLEDFLRVNSCATFEEFCEKHTQWVV